MMTARMTAFAFALLLAAGLTACGGGSVSSGAAGSSGGAGAKSSLVVEISNDERFASVQPEHEDNSVVAAISDLLMRQALAATAGVPIYVDGQQVAVTDETGSAVIALAAGTYEVCVLDPLVATNCTSVTIDPDTVVVVSDVNIDEFGAVTFGSISAESVEDNIVAFQDPNNANKTIVCHQTGAGQFTISVGTPAVLEGHLAHGDIAGPCPGDVDEEGNIGIGGPPDNVPGGGRPENAGPPDGVPGKGPKGDDDSSDDTDTA